MTPVQIPDLKRKFDVMLAHGPYPDWEAIAVPFGRSAKTLRWWCNGDASRHPGTIPATHFVDFLKVLRACLGGDLDEVELRRIALADYAVFVRAFSARLGGDGSLASLIEREGRQGRLTLINAENETTLVERAGARPDLPTWRLGEAFALRLDVSLPGTLILLQATHRAWAFVPINDDGYSMVVRPGGILLPQTSTGGQGGLVEHRDVGHHRFVALVSRGALSPELHTLVQSEAQLDSAALALIGDFYRRLPAGSRTIDVLELRFLRLLKQIGHGVFHKSRSLSVSRI